MNNTPHVSQKNDNLKAHTFGHPSTLKYIAMKKKCYLLILPLLCFLTKSAISQDTLQTEWVLTAASPVANGNAEAWAIGSNAEGQIFWGVNQDMPGLFEYMDAMLWKLDADGNLLRIDTAATGAFAQQSYNLKVTDSKILVAGRTCSSFTVNTCDALVIAVDAVTGGTGWAFEWDGNNGSTPLS
jgi:hypothetical protein